MKTMKFETDQTTGRSKNINISAELSDLLFCHEPSSQSDSLLVLLSTVILNAERPKQLKNVFFPPPKLKRKTFNIQAKKITLAYLLIVPSS